MRLESKLYEPKEYNWDSLYLLNAKVISTTYTTRTTRSPHLRKATKPKSANPLSHQTKTSQKEKRGRRTHIIRSRNLLPKRIPNNRQSLQTTHVSQKHLSAHQTLTDPPKKETHLKNIRPNLGHTGEEKHSKNTCRDAKQCARISTICIQSINQISFSLSFSPAPYIVVGWLALAGFRANLQSHQTFCV